uniref:Uncharacterized protein n=1 Tax=Octopus bimaculoides TaxID=37653 RepID=A0A0L8ICN2_OCTBM
MLYSNGAQGGITARVFMCMCMGGSCEYMHVYMYEGKVCRRRVQMNETKRMNTYECTCMCMKEYEVWGERRRLEVRERKVRERGWRKMEKDTGYEKENDNEGEHFRRRFCFDLRQ